MFPVSFNCGGVVSVKLIVRIWMLENKFLFWAEVDEMDELYKASRTYLIAVALVAQSGLEPNWSKTDLGTDCRVIKNPMMWHSQWVPV